MQSLEAFKKTLAKARKMKVAEGTVVKWKSNIYTYAGVYAAGTWWITGTGRFYGKNYFTDEEFINNVLMKADSVEIATTWDEVK